MALNAVTLDDKYALDSGRVYLTGTQALVRLPMMQRQRDVAAGLNTGCFISGYRGSPLGGVDQQLWSARQFLAKNHIHFQPGVNEDLAATAVWGSQQGSLFGDSNYDGVYSMWYGKGPGVDRSGDVFRHGNLAGSSRHGGVLLLAGDDHTAKSSTTAHQCEHAFMDAMIPVLNPAGVQEFLDLGLYGWAMSRYSGCWVGFKTIGETVDSSASVYVDPHRIDIQMPADFEMPAEGFNIRWPDGVLEQEERLQAHKIYAALAFARANKLDKTIIDSPHKRRLGIVTAGKSYLDVRQALDDLGIDDEMAADIGLSLYKVGMTWPLEREGMRHFAEGLEEIIVVEEKRAVIENQLKEQLYNWRPDVRPRVIGKYDESGNWILPSINEITPARIARVLAQRIGRFYNNERIDQRLAFLEQKEQALNADTPPISRIPYFCSGCPHNTSTKVPEGSRAMAGIGCHYMAIWMDRDTETFTQMGGEGVPWVGQAPFSKTDHVFANLGDGTYFHSGIMAVRAAIAAKVNITYKVLYNDAVAMTGGQPHDGPLDPAMITRQLEAEGIQRIVVVTDEPDKYPVGTPWAQGITIEHRDELDRVQREMREIKGVSVILYDQTCAAEKRRRRKRGLYPDPPKRAFINDAVCEGCGDCSIQSNCVSVAPLETEFGRKRTIDQSSCNKDFSCVNGFCPSFVTVHGGAVRKKKPVANDGDDSSASQWDDLPEPTLPSLDEPYSIVITGVGGTGVVTIGALIGMAAHIEGKGCSVLDMAGLAQKGGAVVSHVRVSAQPEDIHAVRVSAGGAKLLLGCDLVVAAGFDALSKIEKDRGRAVINSHEAVTGDFTRNPDLLFPSQKLQERIETETGVGNTDFLDATQIATAILGDSIATNLFMLGYAWQKGLVPLSLDAIDQAIVLNGVAVEANTRAFRWGRRAANDLAAVQAFAAPPQEPASHHFSKDLDEVIARRSAVLTDYQDTNYAKRYQSLVERVRKAETAMLPNSSALSEAVARYYFKLLAIKDEYEVARLYSSAEFAEKLRQQFEGDFKLSVHLAPPLLAKRDPETGHLKKREFGAWILSAFKLLARFKGLRGGKLDIFGYSEERKMERQLIADYERLIEELIAGLSHDTHALAVDLASVPEHIRGFGHIKEKHIAEAKERETALLQSFRNPEPTRSAAE
ncbi:indolepyruvate ferredoxin oxidoreductase family protein [Pelagibius sp. Alg239-R121]|uniref:indolepyruvate ferredoxin oxidoreductase family protein n=1 Tax=Pelagibius sp. Alg239-R121 TaxID=2993448 RepID=UPI0024A6F940|nr:indolepyruvate ferredoxin oxidoreductase family protein [Pelagibius sp. Alg239-R121]